MMEKAVRSEGRGGESGGGWGGRGGGMWRRQTFSLACLEPTRTGVGSPGAKMEREVGVRRHEPEECSRGEMAKREWERRESGAVQKGTGNGRRGKWRLPPDWAVRREPLGNVKGMGEREAGCIR